MQIQTTDAQGLIETVECNTDTGMGELMKEVERIASMRFIEAGYKWEPVTLTLHNSALDLDYVKITIA